MSITERVEWLKAHRRGEILTARVKEEERQKEEESARLSQCRLAIQTVLECQSAPELMDSVIQIITPAGDKATATFHLVGHRKITLVLHPIAGGYEAYGSEPWVVEYSSSSPPTTHETLADTLIAAEATEEQMRAELEEQIPF